MHSEEQDRAFKQTGTSTISSFGYQSCTWKLYVLFCRRIPRSDCNSGINLVVVLEYTFLELCLNAEQISLIEKI